MSSSSSSSSSEPSAPSLATIPTELVHQICHELDPIGLVSLNQTCARLRSVIPIRKQQLIERLLALECLPQFGGGSPHLRVRDQTLEPPYTPEPWENYRWACTSCLKLRSHVHFDNRSILQLRYRKPTAGSPAANIPSSWTPSLHGKIWGRRAEREPKPVVERQLRLRYRVSIFQDEVFNPPVLDVWTPAKMHNIGLVGFEEMTEEEFRLMDKQRKDALFDMNIRLVENLRCGSNRRNRKCNECRYQTGQLRIQLSDKRGSSLVPIQASRKVRFDSAHIRYFAGLPEHLGIPRPANNVPIGEISKLNGVFVMEPDELFRREWTMYMLRCPGCARWQEMRTFRIGGYAPWWVPRLGVELWNLEILSREYLDTLRCNNCYARENGDLALGKAVSDFAQSMLCDYARRYLEAQLCWGWFALDREVPNLPEEYRKPVKHFLQIMRWLAMRSWDGQDFTPTDVANVKTCHGVFFNLWQDKMNLESNEVIRRLADDFWFQTWLYKFHELEAEWVWMIEYIAMVKDNHGAVAEWALCRDGTAFV